MSMEVFASYTKWCPDARTIAELEALGDDTPLPEISAHAWLELGEMALALARLMPHEQRAAFNNSFAQVLDPDHARMDLPLAGEASDDEGFTDDETEEAGDGAESEGDTEVLAVFSPASCKKISTLMAGQDLESYGELLAKGWNKDWRSFETPEDALEALECIAGCFDEAAEGELGLIFTAI